jgi:hypothetical protein
VSTQTVSPVIQQREWCAAHLEITGQHREIHVADMCIDCFRGVRISVPKLRKARVGRPPRIKRVWHDNAEAIIAATAAYYGMSVDEITVHTNVARISQPRGVAMYLLRRSTLRSYPEIARILGGFHHTTVLHHIRKVADWMRTDSAFRKEVMAIGERFAAR